MEEYKKVENNNEENKNEGLIKFQKSQKQCLLF